MPAGSSGDERAPEPLPSSTLAERLDFLFRRVNGSDRGEYSYREVAHAIEEAGGPSVSATYLMYLRKGQRTNPTLQHLEALARFFGVPVTYFLEDATARDVREGIDLVAMLRDDELRVLARHLRQLSPEGALPSRDRWTRSGRPSYQLRRSGKMARWPLQLTCSPCATPWWRPSSTCRHRGRGRCPGRGSPSASAGGCRRS